MMASERGKARTEETGSGTGRWLKVEIANFQFHFHFQFSILMPEHCQDGEWKALQGWDCQGSDNSYLLCRCCCRFDNHHNGVDVA